MELVILGAGSHVNTDLGMGEQVVTNLVEQRVIDEQCLAFVAADRMAIASGLRARCQTTLGLDGNVLGNQRVNNEVHQETVVLVTLGAVAHHLQPA